MATAAVLPALVSVEEYLHTSYSPDVDYVDGLLEERNVGEIDHSWVQKALLLALTRQEADGKFFARNCGCRSRHAHFAFLIFV